MHYDDWIIFIEEELNPEQKLTGTIYDITHPYDKGRIVLTTDDISEPVMEWNHNIDDSLGDFEVNASEIIKDLEVGEAIGWRASSKSNIPSVNKIHFKRMEEPENLPVIESGDDLDEFYDAFHHYGKNMPNDPTYEKLVMFRYFSQDVMDTYRL